MFLDCNGFVNKNVVSCSFESLIATQPYVQYAPMYEKNYLNMVSFNTKKENTQAPKPNKHSKNVRNIAT